MEIAELTVMRRILKQYDLDAETALAVLLKTLGDDHLRVLATTDCDPFRDYHEPVSTLEAVHQVMCDEGNGNGEKVKAARRPDVPEGQLEGFAKFAAELYVFQDAVRELVGCYADYLGGLDALQNFE
jgi:hypothetical protein